MTNGIRNVTIKTVSLIGEMLYRVSSILALTDLMSSLSVTAGGVRVYVQVPKMRFPDRFWRLKAWAANPHQVLPGHWECESMPRFHVWFAVLWPSFLLALPMPFPFSNINNLFLPYKIPSIFLECLHNCVHFEYLSETHLQTSSLTEGQS